MHKATALFFVLISATALSASIIPTRPLPGLVAPSEGISIDNYPVEIPNGGLVIDNYPVEIPNGGLVIDNLPIEIPNGGLVIDNLPVEIPDSIIIEEPFDPCAGAPPAVVMPLPIEPEAPVIVNPAPMPLPIDPILPTPELLPEFGNNEVQILPEFGRPPQIQVLPINNRPPM